MEPQSRIIPIVETFIWLFWSISFAFANFVSKYYTPLLAFSAGLAIGCVWRALCYNNDL